MTTKATNKKIEQTMKQYESYKDSGMPFIGMVPAKWNVVPIKYVLEQSANGIKIGPFGSTLTGKVSPEYPIKVYGQWNVIGKDFSAGKNYVSEETYNELESYWIHPNDILISMMGTVGKCAIIPEGVPKGIMDSHIVKVRLNDTVIDPQYFYYVYDKDGSNVVMSQVQRDRRGSIMDGLNSSLIKGFIIPLPSLSEQRIIASYLDDKVSQIDAVITEKEKMVEDLQNYRKSVISETVTRGLNPDVPMKDSGIEWIGMIPSNWEMIKLKSIAKVNGRIGFRGYTTEDLVPSGMGAYTIGGKHITNCVLDLSHPDFISWEKYYESPEIMVKKGDILVAQRGSLGKAALVREDIGEATINPSLVLLNIIKINNVFLYYYLISSSTLAYIDLLNTATAVPMISQNQIENIKLPLPSDEEQNQISNYLDEKTSNIDLTVSELQSQIEDLKSYKASLITEAVTGKIDLR